MLLPSEALAQKGIRIQPDELAYCEGRALVVFPNPDYQPGNNGGASTSTSADEQPALSAPTAEGHVRQKVLGAAALLTSSTGESHGQGPKAAAFLNPVQEFNRDLSTAAIQAWERDWNAEKHARRTRGWEKKMARAREGKGAKGKRGRGKGRKVAEDETEEQELEQDEESAAAQGATPQGTSAQPEQQQPPPFVPARFTLLEALAATGLRSIRYARELENLRYVLANDLSAPAIKSMRRNVLLNFPADRPVEEFRTLRTRARLEKEREEREAKKNEEVVEGDSEMKDDTAAAAAPAPAAGSKEAAAARGPAPAAEENPAAETAKPGGESEAASGSNTTASADKASVPLHERIHHKCRLRINEGDALHVMYTHRTAQQGQFDVIDLDPYGTAAMFLDGAVQSVSEGGLLAITCTDMAVLAGAHYPEKAYSLYGGSVTRTEYSHEVALRLVLHAIASAAGRYSRYIQPVLCLSIDFYVRVFVRVWTSQHEVKRNASRTSLLWSCHGCGNNATMSLGRNRPGPLSRDGTALTHYSSGGAPPVGAKCDQCGGSFGVSEGRPANSAVLAREARRLLLTHTHSLSPFALSH